MHESVPTRRGGPTVEAAVRLLHIAFYMMPDGRAASAALIEAAIPAIFARCGDARRDRRVFLRCLSSLRSTRCSLIGR